MARSSARDLAASGVTPRLPREVLRDAVLSRYNHLRKQGLAEEDALQALYPNTLLDLETLRRVTAALVSGANLLFVGPPGSGKTNLAKDIWEAYPKEVMAVDGCPVHDDPFSLVDAAFSKVVPPCPHCKLTYGGVSLKEMGDFDATRVDASQVPVIKHRLREGHGLSRVQGSPEVFPDNLTGSINLAKLEEIGDPNSPLVLEPGKVLQAHRGLLLVDEIGKLPRGTQNVLLQGLQENIVTPAKSRESFPAAFVALATSNLQDLDNISEPLVGRLSLVHVDFNSDHAKNVEIVRRGVSSGGPFSPASLADAAASLIESWRRTASAGDELGEVGSNRTMIDILRRARAHAELAARDQVVAEDFRRGALESMTGRIRARGAEHFAQNQKLVETFVAKRWQESLKESNIRYWCGFSEGVLANDKSEAMRVLDALRGRQEGRGNPDATKLARFDRYVEERERRNGAGPPTDAPKRVFALLAETGAFESKK